MKIHIYWLSKNNQQFPNINEMNEFNKISLNHKMILGPSKEEHDFLIKNFDFYKKSYNENKISFCSDIYRFWKASESKEPICYADATIKFEKNKLIAFLDYLEKENLNFFILESPLILWTGFWVCFNLNKNFNNILKKYKENRKMANAPIELTEEIRKEIKYKPWKKQKYEKYKTLIENIHFLKIDDDFNNSSFVKINPMASWKNKKINAKELWAKKFLKFNKKTLFLRDYLFLKLPKKIQRIIN